MAKIVLYTPDAKCSLMETGIEFESVFLCGIKIAICRENFKAEDPLKIKILNSNDKSESLLDYDRVAAPNISAIEHFSPELRQMIDSTITVGTTLSRCVGSGIVWICVSSVINFVYRKRKFWKNARNYSRPFKLFLSNSAKSMHNRSRTDQVKLLPYRRECQSTKEMLFTTAVARREISERIFPFNRYSMLDRSRHFQQVWWFVVHDQRTLSDRFFSHVIRPTWLQFGNWPPKVSSFFDSCRIRRHRTKSYSTLDVFVGTAYVGLSASCHLSPSTFRSSSQFSSFTISASYILLYSR